MVRINLLGREPPPSIAAPVIWVDSTLVSRRVNGHFELSRNARSLPVCRYASWAWLGG